MTHKADSSSLVFFMLPIHNLYDRLSYKGNRLRALLTNLTKQGYHKTNIMSRQDVI